MRSLRSFTAAVLVAFASAAAAAPTAYVPNEGSGDVSVIDTATDKVTGTFKLAQKARGIAVSADGTRVYLSDQAANALVIVDPQKRVVVGTVPLGDSPEAIYLSPDGKLLAAAIEENDQVLLIDTATLKVVRIIKMRGKNPEHAVWSPDGKWLYVSAEEADSVDIVDVALGQVIKSVKVGDRPRGIGFLPDGVARVCGCGKCGHRQCVRREQARGHRTHQGGEPLERRHRSIRMASGFTYPRAGKAPSRSSTPRPTRSSMKSRSAAARGTWR